MPSLCPQDPVPTVSVLMPAYNAEQTLDAALASIRDQTLATYEVVAVDDGSTDHTPEILAEWGAADPRVRVFTLTPNRGIVTALNHGLQQCRATLIARMDADDRCAPQRLQAQARFLNETPDVGLVSCRVHFGGNREAHAGYAAYVDWINGLLTPEEIARNRFVESPLAHPSVMFRETCVRTAGDYRDGDFPEDYELWLRWLDAGIRMAKLDAALLTWNDPPNRLSRNDRRYAVRAFYRCKAAYLARWLATHNPHHPEIILWGAGRETRKRADMLTEHGITITAYVDVDPRKIGQTIHGRPVLAERQLPPPTDAFVVSYVGSRGARDDIRNRLRALDYNEETHFIMGA